MGVVGVTSILPHQYSSLGARHLAIRRLPFPPNVHIRLLSDNMSVVDCLDRGGILQISSPSQVDVINSTPAVSSPVTFDCSSYRWSEEHSSGWSISEFPPSIIFVSRRGDLPLHIVAWFVLGWDLSVTRKCKLPSFMSPSLIFHSRQE